MDEGGGSRGEEYFAEEIAGNRTRPSPTACEEFLCDVHDIPREKKQIQDKVKT